MNGHALAFTRVSNISKRRSILRYGLASPPENKRGPFMGPVLLSGRVRLARALSNALYDLLAFPDSGI